MTPGGGGAVEWRSALRREQRRAAATAAQHRTQDAFVPRATMPALAGLRGRVVAEELRRSIELVMWRCGRRDRRGGAQSVRAEGSGENVRLAFIAPSSASIVAVSMPIAFRYARSLAPRV